MKAYVFANPETMQIAAVSQEEGDTKLGTRIGVIDTDSHITVNTIRLAVGAMLSEAHLPVSGWTINLITEIVQDPS